MCKHTVCLITFTQNYEPSVTLTKHFILPKLNQKPLFCDSSCTLYVKHPPRRPPCITLFIHNQVIHSFIKYVALERINPLQNHITFAVWLQRKDSNVLNSGVESFWQPERSKHLADHRQATRLAFI